MVGVAAQDSKHRLKRHGDPWAVARTAGRDAAAKVRHSACLL